MVSLVEHTNVQIAVDCKNLGLDRKAHHVALDAAVDELEVWIGQVLVNSLIGFLELR